MGDPVYTAFCGLGVVLSLMFLPWHCQVHSVSTLIFLGWIFLACLVALINSLLWADNVDDKAPIWCDITIRFKVALHPGIVMAGLCVQRRLYRIATIKEVDITRQSRRKELIINLFLGVGLPVLTIPLYYVVQGFRYIIVENIGCWPSVSTTILSALAFHMLPFTASLVSSFYATCDFSHAV